ncbi:hypothetical protein LCM17_23010 [Cereibacter sphaeroides]|nr:hypothetical protein [Cereibacter sphaeroides]
MTGFVGRLRATLGLDSAEFSNKLRGARQEAQGFSVSVAQGLRGLAGPALGLTAVAGTVAAGAMQVRDVMRDIATIGDEAQRAGLSAEAFQEWSHVAAQARIPVDALTDGFKEMALRADEFVVTGGGSAAEAFNRLGFSADDLARRLENPSELFTEIVRRLERFDAGSRIRITDEIFGGTGGERFVALISRGAAAMDDTRRRARELGLVLDENVINRATIIDQKFQELTARVQGFFRAAAVGLFAGGVETPEDTLERLFGSLDRAREALGEDMFSSLTEQAGELGDETEAALSRIEGALPPMIQAAGEASVMITELVGKLAQAGRLDAAEALRGVNDELVSMMAAAADGSMSVADFRTYLDSALTGARDLVTGLVAVDDARFTGVMGRLSSLITRLGEAARAGVAARNAMPGSMGMTPLPGTPLDPNGPILPGDANMTSSPRPPRAPRDIDFDLPGSDNSGSGGGSSETYATMIADIRERTSALRAEATALAEVAASGVEYGDAAEYARIRAELLTQAQEEGRALTPELRAEIDAAAAAYVTQTEAVDDLTEALERQRAAGERGAQAVTDILMAAGESAEAGRNAVARLIMEIARMQMMRGSQALAGTSWGGGFFSFIGNLIGKNARGTESWRGGLTVVGEEGPELVNLPTGAKITPALATAENLRNGGGGGTGPTNAHITVSIDENGNLQAFVDKRASRAVQAAKPGMTRDAVAATRASVREFPLR